MNAFARYDAQGRLVEERPLTIAEAAERHGLGSNAGNGAAVDRRRWYVVRRMAQTDSHALRWLKKLGLEYYYPFVWELRRTPVRKLSRSQRASGLPIMRPRVVPLFPGYIFVLFDMSGDRWGSVIREFAGVGGLVSEGNLPVEIAPALIDAIKAAEVDGVVPGKTPAALIFKRGARVRVVDGALSGYLATIESTPDYSVVDVDAQTRIRIAVEAFGRTTSVDLSVAQIEKL